VAPLDSVAVALRRLRLVCFFVGSAGTVVAAESVEVPLPIVSTEVLLALPTVAAAPASPLPPTAEPAGGWNEPRNCWIEPGISPFG
jgi:hypothetical protein